MTHGHQFTPRTSLVRIAEALGRIARVLEGFKVDGDQELSPDVNLDAFWCTNCGDHFYTGIRLEPTAVTCPFCQSDKVRVRQ